MVAHKDYPYIIHTNQELELMLKGVKPLAVFCVDNKIDDIDAFTKQEAQSNQDFESYVKNGQLHEDHIRIFCDSAYIFDYYAYTLPNEKWRSTAYFVLMSMLHKENRWCDNMEYLSGTLLGYTQEQNNYHLTRTRIKSSCLPITSTP